MNRSDRKNQFHKGELESASGIAGGSPGNHTRNTVAHDIAVYSPTGGTVHGQGRDVPAAQRGSFDTHLRATLALLRTASTLESSDRADISMRMRSCAVPQESFRTE